MDVASALILGVLIIVIYLLTSKPYNYPPGPFRWPVVGSVKVLSNSGGHVGKAWKKLAEKYGGIFGTFMFNQRVVVLNDYQLIKEAFTKDEFSGRPNQYMAMFRVFGEKRGLLLSDGTKWADHRRFSLKNLRDLGLGKKEMAAGILEEIDDLLAEWKELEGKPVDVSTVFNVSVFNVIWLITAGKRYSRTDPRVIEIVDLVNQQIRLTERLQAHFGMQYFRFLFPEQSGYNLIKRCRDRITALLMEEIREHQKTYDGNDMRDFIDIFIREMKTQDRSRDFSEMQLYAVLSDFFFAGSETTSTTLQWAVLLLMLSPQVQAKIHQEVDEVIGRSRAPSLDDRGKIPYTEAALLEIQRYGSVVPMALPHRAMRDAKIAGYDIPKDTDVISNLYAVHHDQRYWGDPENFRPERFLTEDGKLRQDERLVPFGIGRRVCLGESLAKAELFLFFTSLVQKLEFFVPPGQEPPKPEQQGGITSPPVSFKAYFKFRP